MTVYSVSLVCCMYWSLVDVFCLVFATILVNKDVDHHHHHRRRRRRRRRHYHRHHHQQQHHHHKKEKKKSV